uniref:Acyl-CoA thioesterase 16 n=1 Tax=Sander lucioperca TaxID=283035 RepID=A0A8C9Y056_SANLU
TSYSTTFVCMFIVLTRLSTMSDTVAPMLSVFPSRALVDENFKVVVENLPPGSPVTLHSLHQCEDKHYWEAYGHYISNHRGTVSVTDDLSFGGTYTGKEAMGLLWSMRPVPGSREGLRLRKRNVCSPLLVNISVYRGHVVEGFREQAPLASSLTERWYMAPGGPCFYLQVHYLKNYFLVFFSFCPGPFPGLLDVWGGGGGLVEYRSALLGSHGYASLALEYFAPGELKSSDLEFNYFETAFNIVKDHPQVMPDKVGIFGLSLGASLTLLLAAESSIIKPSCCVCVSGPLTHIGLFYKPTLKSFFLVISFKVGRINCPVMVVNTTIKELINKAGNLHLLTRLYYPDAGHLIEPPYTPHFRATKFVKDTKEKVILLWGGQTKPHSDAQEDSWKKILAFLEQNLKLSHSEAAAP